MKTIDKIGILLLFLAVTVGANAQARDIRKGNRDYHHGNYTEAESEYKESLNKKYNDKAKFTSATRIISRKITKKPPTAMAASLTVTCRKMLRLRLITTSATA